MTVDREALKSMSGPDTVALLQTLDSEDDINAVIEEENARPQPRKTVLDAAEKRQSTLSGGEATTDSSETPTEESSEPTEEQAEALDEAKETLQTDPAVSAAPGSAEPLQGVAGPEGEPPDPAAIEADASAAAEHDPSTDGLRPEVIHQESGPPVEAIRESLDQAKADAEAAAEADEPETVEVRADLIDDILGGTGLAGAQAEMDALIEAEKIEEEGIEAAREQASEVGSLQEAAELAMNYPSEFSDPFAAAPVESSAVDTLGQREDAARAAAEPLRQEVAATIAGRPENSGQHVLASLAAEAGEQWPADAVDTETLLEERDAETAEAKKAAGEQARSDLAKLEGDAAIIPHLREGQYATTTAANPNEFTQDNPEAKQNQGYVTDASHGPMAIGHAVSRVDEAHGEIGVVTDVDTANENHALLYVEFPSEESGWLPPASLNFEGVLADMVPADKQEEPVAG